MRRKRVKKVYASSLRFQYSSYDKAKNCIKSFLTVLLSQFGLKRYKDYVVCRDYLVVRHLKDTIRPITVILKEAFPVFNYYWETSSILVWF